MNSKEKQQHEELSGDKLLRILEALANPHRLRIISILTDGRMYVSQLAREIQVSRPLLYMHLKKLESANLVTNKLEISDDGKAMNYYEINLFIIRLSPKIISEAIATLTIKKLHEKDEEK